MTRIAKSTPGHWVSQQSASVPTFTHGARPDQITTEEPRPPRSLQYRMRAVWISATVAGLLLGGAILLR